VFPLDQRAAGRRGRVVERGEEVFSPLRAIGVVAGTARLVNLQVAGVSRVRAAAELPQARRGGLQGRVAGALVVRVTERVRHHAGELARQVDDHAVHGSVAVGRNEGRALRSVQRLVERPRALAGALRGRVADPYVRGAGLGVRAVQAALAHAEALHGDVLRGEDQRDAALLGLGPRGESGDLRQGEGRAHGAAVVGHLVVEHHPGFRRGSAGIGRRGLRRLGQVLLVNDVPPLRHGRRGGLGHHGEGEQEVVDDRLLHLRETAVPEHGNEDVGVEHGSVVVGEHVRRIGLIQLHAPPCPHG